MLIYLSFVFPLALLGSPLSVFGHPRPRFSLLNRASWRRVFTTLQSSSSSSSSSSSYSSSFKAIAFNLLGLVAVPMSTLNQSSSLNGCTKFPLPPHDQMTTTTHNHLVDETQSQPFDYSKRAQWLRAAVLGANDGLVSTASLMMGVGAVKHDIKAMILTGFAGLVAGACSMAIGEFVSVYSQLDIEMAHIQRNKDRTKDVEEEEEERENLPNPLQAAAASALAFSVGAMVPLLAAAFIKEYRVRLGVVATAVTIALVGFGWLGAALGKAPPVRSSVRVLIGGWVAMAVTFGLTKLIGSSGM